MSWPAAAGNVLLSWTAFGVAGRVHAASTSNPPSARMKVRRRMVTSVRFNAAEAVRVLPVWRLRLDRVQHPYGQVEKVGLGDDPQQVPLPVDDGQATVLLIEHDLGCVAHPHRGRDSVGVVH